MTLPKKPQDKKHYHWHHIVPRYMGGTDDIDNLVLLLPKDHAQAHLDRYNEFGNPADLHAAKILFGSLKENGLPIDTTGIKRPEISGINHPSYNNPAHGQAISNAKKGITTRCGYTLSDDHKAKIGAANSIALKGNVPWNKGKSGRHWFNNGTVTKIMECAPDDTWKPGRLLNA